MRSTLRVEIAYPPLSLVPLRVSHTRTHDGLQLRYTLIGCEVYQKIVPMSNYFWFYLLNSLYRCV
jgi:hypothetical protein